MINVKKPHIKNFKHIFFLSVAIIFFASFIWFSQKINRPRAMNFDFDTTVKLQNKVPTQIDYFFKIFSILGSFDATSIFVLAFACYFYMKKKKKIAVILLFIFLTIPLEMMGKWFLYHPGPPKEFFRRSFDLFLPSGFVRTDFSYPSGHAARTVFLSMIGFFLLPKNLKGLCLRAGIVIFMIIMLFSRVALGEHWTTDVVGGSLLGAGVAALALSL